MLISCIACGNIIIIIMVCMNSLFLSLTGWMSTIHSRFLILVSHKKSMGGAISVRSKGRRLNCQ